MIGWQRKYIYCVENIYELLVKYILSYNFASGRMMVCNNLKLLVDHLHFIEQKNILACLALNKIMSQSFQVSINEVYQ